MFGWREIQSFLAWFGKNQLLGVPADIVAHVAVGAMIFLATRRLRGSRGFAWAFLLVLCVGKEVFVDPHVSTYLNAGLESAKDIGFSLMGGAITELALLASEHDDVQPEVQAGPLADRL